MSGPSKLPPRPPDFEPVAVDPSTEGSDVTLTPEWDEYIEASIQQAEQDIAARQRQVAEEGGR